MHQTDNTRIQTSHILTKPDELLQEMPVTPPILELIYQTRESIRKILQGEDKRLLVIVGPCSIHDPKAAMEYATQLSQAIEKYKDNLCIIMRVYFEKPRTQIGWKGLINDPTLDNQFNINQGLKLARKLLIEINQLGVPTASELLDTIIPQYIADLLSWSAIGARTTESQIHRELASGISTPLGFKNGTTGSIKIAIDAVLAASYPHHFLGISKKGIATILYTTGNPDCHVILRGSTEHTNYDRDSIAYTVGQLKKAHLPHRVMIDCSHGNSRKQYLQQIDVINDITEQLQVDPSSIMGVMIESNLVEGKQELKPNHPLTYGQSITDGCLSWKQTKPLLEKLASTMASIK